MQDIIKTVSTIKGITFAFRYFFKIILRKSNQVFPDGKEIFSGRTMCLVRPKKIFSYVTPLSRHKGACRHKRTGILSLWPQWSVCIFA